METVARKKNFEMPFGAKVIFAWRKRSGLSLVAAVMAVGLASPYGAFAAETSGTVTSATLAPINLAGRWSGHHYGFASKRILKGEETAAARNTLAYDIVACGDSWCGIAVTGQSTCGSIALKMARDPKSGRGNAFNGKLELAKGSALYVVEAWYSAPNTTTGEGSEKAHLNFVGDTGGELLMMRRSFPFQAEMARVGEPLCTLDKATS